MAASSNSRSKNNHNTTKNTNAPVLTFSFSSSMSPSMASSHPSDPFPTSSFASSSSSSMASSIFNNRPSSPTRVNVSPSLSSSSSSSLQAFRISLNNHHGNRSLSPNSRSVSVRDQVIPRRPSLSAAAKKTCMCSPTNHPGSFRCAYHRNSKNGGGGGGGGGAAHHAPSPIRLNLRRSAMTNSLVRIGTVEGDWVKRALTALIRPSSHQQRRRGSFQPRPSRLSVMSKAAD